MCFLKVIFERIRTTLECRKLNNTVVLSLEKKNANFFR